MSEDIRLQMTLDDLSGSDAETRLAAMEMLGQARYRPAIPALVEALRDADASIRAAADEALRKIGGLASLPLLLDLLRTDDLPEKARVIDLSHELIRGFWRELHDGAAAKLAAAVMQVAIVERMMQRSPEQVAEEMKQLKQLTSQASQEVRDIITNLRPPAADSG